MVASLKYSLIAQQVEHLTVNQRVVGSSPTEGAKTNYGNKDCGFTMRRSKALFVTIMF